MKRLLKLSVVLSVLLLAAWYVARQPIMTETGRLIEQFTSGQTNPVKFVLDHSGFDPDNIKRPTSELFLSDLLPTGKESEEQKESEESSVSDTAHAYDAPVVDLSQIPAWSGTPYYVLNDNQPFFSAEDRTVTSEFLILSDLDELGRCGSNYISVCPSSMPDEEREGIGQVRPSGWQTSRYDDLINGKYLYNRCHLIGFQLSGLNADERNLITGTRYLNVDGQLPFENEVAAYVRQTGNHVLYRVTPVYDGEDLVATGVIEEGYSVEDGGAGICFCVFCYNIQPGVVIDYSSGDNWISDNVDAEMEIAVECGATSVVGNEDPFFSS